MSADRSHGYNSFDAAQLGKAFAAPGMDTRQWVSFGVVDQETGDQKSVEFNADYGPLVSVTLQPSAVGVRCRVAMSVSGSGEGEYHPFIGGDEVIVVVPEGHERAGCTIVGRCSNQIDTFPMQVGGLDVTKNVFAFKRLKVPYVLESAGSLLLRNATTKSFMSFDSLGNVTVNDGSGNFFTLTSSFLSLQLADGSGQVQIIPPTLTKNAQVFLQAHSASFTIDDKKSVFTTPGVLKLATGGVQAVGHAVTTEQVYCIIANIICQLAIQGAFSGPFATGSWVIPGAALIQLTALFAAAVPGAVLPSPIGTLGVPGGDLTLTAIGPLILAAMQAQLPDLTAVTGLPLTFKPGIGKQSLLL